MKIKLFAFNKDSVTGTSFEIPTEIYDEEELEGKQDYDLLTSIWVNDQIKDRFDLPLDQDIHPYCFDLTLYREV